MNFKRIGRVLVCLLVICCMLVNLSPIRAEAVAITATVAGTGIAATLFAMAMGVVFVDMTAELITGMGESMTTHLEETTTDDEKDILETWIGGIKENLDTNGISGLLSIPEELMDNVVSWAVGLIKGDGVEVEEEVDTLSLFSSGPFICNVNGKEYTCAPYYKGQTLLPVVLLTNDSTPRYYFYIISSTANGNSNKFIVNGSAVNQTGTLYCTTDGYYYRYYTVFASVADYVSSYKGFIEIGYPDDGDVSCFTLPSTTTTTTVTSSVYVGDIPQQVQDGTIDEDDVKIQPVYFGDWITSTETAADEINAVATQLANGTMTYEDYMDMTEYKTDTSTDTGTDTGTDAGVISGTFADTKVGEFIESLVTAIAVPFEWIWSKIEALFGPWIESIEAWFSEVGAKIEAIPGAFAGWFSDVIDGVLSIPAAIGGVFEDVIAGVVALPQTITDALTNVLTALFIPTEDYLTVKVDAMCAEFAFADSIVRTGEALKLGLADISTEPPVIYIHLGDTEGSYNIGGTVPFLDLRWYARYKPTVDTMISAFLWICFVWRMLLKLPGIISGMPGDFVMASAHQMGVAEHLPTRSKEYETQRISNRQMIRKGPDK